MVLTSRHFGLGCWMVVLYLAGIQPANGQEVLDLFFLAGQSNATGVADHNGTATRPAEPLTGPLPDSRIRYWYSSGGINTPREDSLAWGPLRTLSLGDYGPEFGLGRELDSLGYNTGIIKVAWGGTNLMNDWNSRTGGPLWQQWQQATTTAINSLMVDDIQFRIRGFFWMQGESDAWDPTYAAAYEDNFSNLVEDFEVHLNNLGADTSQLRFVTGLIDGTSGNFPDIFVYNDTVIDAQKQVMNSLGPRGRWLSTGAFQTYDEAPGLGINDALHFTGFGAGELGAGMARAFASPVPEPSLPAMAILVWTGLCCRRFRHPA